MNDLFTSSNTRNGTILNRPQVPSYQPDLTDEGLDQQDLQDLDGGASQPDRFQNPVKARIRMQSGDRYWDLSIPTFEDTAENRDHIKLAAAHLRKVAGKAEEGGSFVFLKFLKPGETIDRNGRIVPMTQNRPFNGNYRRR